MRKIFTRLISIFILSSVFVLQGFAQTFPVLGPGSDFTNHKKSDTFVLTASEEVVPGVGVVRLLNSEDATLAAYQATNSHVSITEADGTYEISVDFTSFLVEGGTYTLEVDANFVKSADGGTPNSSNSWAVTVGDYTAPVLATTDPLDPANGETEGVLLDQSLMVTFIEDIHVVDGGQVYIYTDNGTTHGDLFDVVSGTGLTVSGGVLTIVPNKNFEELTKYYVVIPGNVVTDASVNENKFAGWVNNTSWVFTTRDATAPEITEIMKDNVASDAFDVVLQLDKPGKVYVLAVAKDATAPDASTVIGSGESEVVAAAGTNVTVSLSGFAEASSYDVYVVTENAEGVQSGATKELTVTTADVTAPTVQARFPEDGDNAATINDEDNLVLDISEDIKLGTGSFDIYTWDASLNHELLVSVPVASCTIVGGDSLEIPVDKSLWMSEATYFVKYNEGVITDKAGNKLAALDNTEGWKFTVQDFLAPTYTIVPADGTADASETAPQVTITFNEALYSDASGTAMTAGDISSFITLKKGTSAAAFTSTLTGNVVQLTITSVASRDTFELSIDTKKVYDASGNVGTKVDVVNFVINDFEGPTVTIEPLEPGASDNILVKFNEPVFNANGTTITNADVANIVIFRKGTSSSGAIVAATYTVAADAMSFIIDPTNDFTTPGVQYYVRLGAGAVEDEAGNPNVLADATLTISDFIAPTAEFSGIGTSPVDPTAVAPVITFSEAMATLDGTPVAVNGDATNLINLKEDGNNIPFTAEWTSTSEITITASYEPNKTYTISVGKSLEDLAGNAFDGVSTSFSTWSDVAPAMVSVSPEDGATEQANDVALEVTFDQDIQAGTGGVTVAGTTSGNATVTTSIDGAVLTIGHSAFVPNETVTVTVDAGAVTGMNNEDAPVVAWSFNTKDTQAPAVATYSPTDNATDVALDSKLSLTFNEDIVLKTGQISIKDASNDVTVQTLTEANVEVTDGNMLEITPVANFDYAKEYYVIITSGLVEDAAGNAYPGITDPTKWSFTTVENPGAFMVETSNPADGEDKVADGITSITVDFNRDIKAGSLSNTAMITLNDGTTDVITDVANSSRFSISGSTLTINTLSDIVADKTYTLTLDAGIVMDNWDTPSDAATIVFYTKDNYGPKVVSTTPMEDATDVSVNTTVVVTWDETPLFSGAAISAAGIKNNSLVTVNGSTAYTASVNGLVWTLTLDAPLAEKTDYTVVVKQTAVEDALGNTQTADYSWMFTTEDASINTPTVSFTALSSGTAGDTDVYATVSTSDQRRALPVTFSEAGSINSISIYHEGGTGSMLLGVYSDQSGTPGALMGVTAVSTVNATAGWQTVSLISPVEVSAGQTIWLASVFETNPGIRVAVGTPGRAYSGETWTAGMPSSFGAVIIENYRYSVYCNYTSGENAITGTSISFTVDFDEAGMVYYMVAPADATAPSAADIMTANSIEFTAAGTSDEQTVMDLMSDTDYTIYLVAVDESGNQSSIVDVDFSTADITAPSVLSMVPENGAVDVAADAQLVLTFDEAVVLGGGHVVIREMSTDIIVEDFDVNSGNTVLSNGNKTATITRTIDLESKTAYYVEITKGTFEDAAGNPVAGINGSESWAFTTKDTVAPLLVSTTPDYEATTTPEIAAGTALSLEFDEAMKVGAGVVYVKYASDDEVFDVINADALTLSEDMKIISFNLTNVPAEQTEFYVDLSNIALADTADNAWVDTPLASGEWNFIILDQTPPSLVSSTPEDGATGVEINTTIELTFSEGIFQNPDATDFNATDAYIGDEILVKDESGATVALDTVTIDVDRKVVTIVPKDDLTSETMYTVYVSPVVDNRMNVSDEMSVSFTTKDDTKPFVTMWHPDYMTVFNPRTGVVTVTFSEPIYDGIYTDGTNTLLVDVLDENIPDFFNYNMVTDTTQNSDGTLATYTKGADVAFTGTISADKTVITLTPVEADVPLASGEGYVVELIAGVVEDAAGNQNAADFNIFGIEDYESPNATAYAPTGATMADDEMTITFDEDIAVGSGNIYVRNYDNGEVVETIAIDATTATVEDNVATIAHADFPEAMNFYVTADAGTFTDATANANPWEGIAQEDINIWKFSTADAVAPGVIAEGGLFPAPGSTNVPMNTPIEITFDKKIQLNSDTETRWVVIYNEDWTPYQVIEVNSSNVNLKPVTDPYYETSRVFSVIHMNLQPNSTYYVRVMEGSVVDMAGNSFAGIDDDSWSFTTEDNAAPTIVNLTPADDANDVLVTDELTIEFDRGVMGNAAGMISLYKEEPGVAIGTLVETIDPTSDAVTIEGAVATVMLSQALEPNTGYYVIVEAGSFTNVATSRLPLDPGLTTTQDWNFTTSDSIPVNAPEIESLSPNKETIADNHPTFVMTFVDDVMFGEAGNLYVTEKDSATPRLTIPITADMVSGNTVTVDYLFDEVGGLDTSKTYIVTVDSGVVLSGDDVAFEGISSDTTWTFTTGPDFDTAVQPPLTETVNFKVYPNPFNDRIMIDNNDKLTRVMVINIAGQKVIDREYPEHTISTSNLVSGVYVISMFTEDGLVKTERMVKR